MILPNGNIIGDFDPSEAENSRTGISNPPAIRGHRLSTGGEAGRMRQVGDASGKAMLSVSSFNAVSLFQIVASAEKLDVRCPTRS
jgi:hypothetical protein